MHTKGHSVFGFLDLRQVFDLQGDPSMGEQDDILAAVETDLVQDCCAEPGLPAEKSLQVLPLRILDIRRISSF